MSKPRIVSDEKAREMLGQHYERVRAKGQSFWHSVLTGWIQFRQEEGWVVIAKLYDHADHDEPKKEGSPTP